MKRIGRILLCILMITVLFGISIMGNFVVKSENKSKEKKRTAITKEEMKEWAAPDEEMLEYYDLGEFSTTIPIVYMNTKGPLLIVNLIKNNIALSFTKIVKRMKKKCHLQEWEQTVNGC